MHAIDENLWVIIDYKSMFLIQLHVIKDGDDEVAVN